MLIDILLNKDHLSIPYMAKNNDKKTNNDIDEYPLFSKSDVSDLLKYREQVVTDANHHSNEFVSAVKYYTTLISALFSLLITITIACIKLFIDNLQPNSNYLFLSIIFIPFVAIPLIIIFLCRFALDNSERLYRNTMEYVSIKMKIDEILGTYNSKIFSKLRNKYNLKLFEPDKAFTHSKWERKKYQWYPKSSEDFVNDKINDKDAGYKIFSRVFETFIIIGYIFVIISLIIAIIIILPFICQFFC